MNSSTSFTLDFGMVMQDSGLYTGDFAVMNFLGKDVPQKRGAVVFWKLKCPLGDHFFRLLL